MPGKLIAVTKITYDDMAAFTTAYNVIDTFMDNNSGTAKFGPIMRTDDTLPEVTTQIIIKFEDITREVMNTRMNQIQGASGLFPGATVSCRYYEDITVDMP